MTEFIQTRLRFVSAKKPESIILWVNSLAHKIEIKGMPVFANKRWTLWFILPETTTVRDTGNVKLDN